MNKLEQARKKLKDQFPNKVKAVWFRGKKITKQEFKR